MTQSAPASKSTGVGDALRLVISKRHLFVQFLTLQGTTVVANLLYGLLCVRLLPTDDYAKFVVLFGVQNTLLVLMDSNFSNSLIPLVGEQIHDHPLIAGYLASLRSLALRLYLLVGFGVVFLFPLLVRRRHWGWPTVAAMVVILLGSSWFLRMGSQYGAVLVLLRERTLWYRAQLISSLGTLALLGGFWALHRLSAFSAILINVAGMVFVGIFYWYWARRKLGGLGRPSREKSRAIVHLAAPLVPHTIFYAFQGQISLLLITWFGRNSGIAGVGALGRLNQIYSVFGHLLPLLVEPHFARVQKSRLAASYAVAVALCAALCGGISACAYFFPEVFLWVLGPRYASMRFEVFLSVAGSSIAFLGGLLWNIHNARRFVYWWSSGLSIALTLLVQIAFIWKADLTTVRIALLLNLSMAAVSLLVNIASGVCGFLFGPRVTSPAEPAGPIPPEIGTPDLDPLQIELQEG